MIKILLVLFAFNTGFSSELPLRGEADYRWLFMHIYNAKLWANNNEIYSEPFTLELKYGRNFKGVHIVDQSIKELKHAGVGDLEQWRAILLPIFPDIKEGNTIQAKFDPKLGVVFHLDKEKELGRIEDINMAKDFLNIWLGDKASDPKFRNKLLGGKNE